MRLSWNNDPNLSDMSDKDYLTDIIHLLTGKIAENPQVTSNYFLRGNAYLDAGKNEEGIADFNKVIDLSPSNDVALNNRGICYRLLRKTKEAISDFNQAILLNTEYRDAYNNRGQVYSDLGEFNLAIDDYSKAIEMDSSYAYAYANRGISKYYIGVKTVMKKAKNNVSKKLYYFMYLQRSQSY